MWTKTFQFLKLFALCSAIFAAKFAWPQGNFFTENKIQFTSTENLQKKISSLRDPDILVVSFGFDPYAPDLRESYLPEGYITVNGEYDATALVIKHFFVPLFQNENLKFLILDLDSFLKNPTQKKVRDVKMLVENLASTLAKTSHSVLIGFKFKYDQNSRESLERLFAYTSVPMLVKGIQIESGYADFFAQKSYQDYFKNLKYLNVTSNTIGSQKEDYKNFLHDLNRFQKLEILNLGDNAIGGLNGNLKLFSDQILYMKNLRYLNLENNLIGAYKEDSREFMKSMQQFKYIVVNLNHNLN